jgi:hypothetical protein
MTLNLQRRLCWASCCFFAVVAVVFAVVVGAPMMSEVMVFDDGFFNYLAERGR